MIVLRRCAACGSMWEVNADKDKNTKCPACRSKTGARRQTRIQMAATKKRTAKRKKAKA